MTDHAPAPVVGRAIFLRDDLNGYAAVLAWDGPPRERAQTANLITVSLGYGPVAPADLSLSSVTIAYPGTDWGETVPPPAPSVLIGLRPGMTDSEVARVLAPVEDAHRKGLAEALAALRRCAERQWLAELDHDDPYPSRPLSTLDRDHEAHPNPDPARVAADRATIQMDLQAIDDLHAAVGRVIATPRADRIGADRIGADRIGADRIPDDLPSQTSLPIHLLATALTDAPSGRNWAHDDGNGHLVHQRPGLSGRVTVSGAAAVSNLPAWAAPAVWIVLQRDGPRGLLALAAMDTLVGMTRDALQSGGTGVVQVELDHLARRIGLQPHSHADRVRNRTLVADMIRAVSAIRVETPGPRTRIRERGKVVDMSWYASILVVEEVLARAGGVALIGTGEDDFVPYAIRVRGSDRLLQAAHLGNHALPVLGRGGRIGGIPAGQPGGSWARGIAHALTYFARRQADTTIIARRKDLLTTYPGEPHPVDILTDPRSARRAVGYWKGAIAVLRALDGPPLILSIEDPEAPTGRGWSAGWLAQGVRVRLNPEAPEMAGLASVQASRVTHLGTPRRRPTAL